MNIVYQIQFLSDWQCSSGLTAGADLDDTAIKDEDGLPYIPGRTLKGLLREAAESLWEFTGDTTWKEFIRRCFGNQSDKKSDQSEEGESYFSDAMLCEPFRQWLLSDSQEAKVNSSEKRRTLYRRISSTAIEEDGQAKEHSLRCTEVVVPLTLYAQIENCPNAEKMQQCMQWVKRLGSKRNRGLGRCHIQIQEVKNV